MNIHKITATKYGNAIYFKCDICSYNAIYDGDEDKLKVLDRGNRNVIHSADPSGLIDVKLKFPNKAVKVTFSCKLEEKGYGRCSKQCRPCKNK